MKLKTMLLGVSMALAFTMPINAAQYTVIEGQLPVPGADASIPENAYQNYRYGDTSKVPDFEIKESLKLSFKEIDEIAREPEMSQVNTNALKEANIRYMDLLSHDSTVILLHEKGYNAKLTAPIRTVEGIVTPLKSEGITSFAIDRYAMASLSGTTETPEQAFNESSAGRKGAFTYPGIRAGTWIITDSSKNDNNPTMLAHVIFDDQPNHTYIATLSKFGQSDVVKNLESAMANIVIPSMQSLDPPEQEFGVQVHTNTLIDFSNSVSVKSIQKRCGVSQSSVSTFMTMLERADLVESRKIDQYTYYRRNEKVIREFGDWYNKEVSIQADNIDKLLETVTLDDTSYPSIEDSSMPEEEQAIGIATKGLDHENDNT